MKTIVICGPTATGKTAFSIELAKKLSTEIISADSSLVYKELNIGTAKPTLEEMQGIQHHMISCISAKENQFSVASYLSCAEPILQKLENRGQTPIVCGGTGFYIQALLFQKQYATVAANEEIRQKYLQLAQKYGNAYVHQYLSKVDAYSAKLLHPNDLKRVIRAIEIFEMTGKSREEYRDDIFAKREYIAVAFAYDREELYAKINRRVVKMFKMGFIEEVESLLKDGIDERYQCMQAIGYKEIIAYLQNKCSYDEMFALIQQRSRNYAKRQITFFKKLSNIHWISPKEKIMQKLERLL